MLQARRLRPHRCSRIINMLSQLARYTQRYKCQILKPYAVESGLDLYTVARDISKWIRFLLVFVSGERSCCGVAKVCVMYGFRNTQTDGN